MSPFIDKQPGRKVHHPTDPDSILITCKDKEKTIRDTLQYIAQQDYQGELKIIVIDNASTDETSSRAMQAGQEIRGRYRSDLALAADEWQSLFRASCCCFYRCA
ncbi:glycosyltransferase [Neobacillus dielmonensis]|uniref:glycosyltransferase n=1 Tax=Neobacillus dielmonensis TaxID=1347369 RepID=UPI0005A856A8|nr:glycosyltransferase [Neobacillus dielmonensis]